MHDYGRLVKTAAELQAAGSPGRVAYHYDQVRYIHPFREGNGRVQRVFWNRIAVAAGWQLDWRPVHGDVNDRAPTSVTSACCARCSTKLLRQPPPLATEQDMARGRTPAHVVHQAQAQLNGREERGTFGQVPRQRQEQSGVGIS
jgi:fido (protein-threonine AMPylation protein)